MNDNDNPLINLGPRVEVSAAMMLPSPELQMLFRLGSHVLLHGVTLNLDKVLESGLTNDKLTPVQREHLKCIIGSIRQMRDHLQTMEFDEAEQTVAEMLSAGKEPCRGDMLMVRLHRQFQAFEVAKAEAQHEAQKMTDQVIVQSFGDEEPN